jgi:acyl-CoA thioester hydrolase
MKIQSLDQLQQQYPVSLDLNVQWGEMDAAQHVNNIVYLRYFETARIHYFRAIDFMNFGSSHAEDSQAVGPILAEISCRYKIPLTFPDTVTVAARVLPDSFDEYGFVMNHVVFSHKHQRIAAEGSGRLVCYDYQNLCKAPVPETLKEKILALG